MTVLGAPSAPAVPVEPAAPAAVVEPTVVTPPAAPAAPSVTTPVTVDWKAALEDDIRNDPSMGHIPDIQTLAKSYVNAQRMVGADKLVVPSKHATEEEWRNTFVKLGLPANVADYKVTTPEGSLVDDDFLKGFSEKSYGLNLLPQQAQGLLDWHEQQVADMVTKSEADSKISSDKEFQGLRDEWGPGFDSKVLLAQSAVKQFGDENLTAYLNESGLGDQPKIIKLFAKIGEAMSESKFEGMGPTSGGPEYSTPAEAEKKFNAMLADPKGAYLDKHHPNHAKAVQEATGYMAVVTAAKQANA